MTVDERAREESNVYERKQLLLIERQGNAKNSVNERRQDIKDREMPDVSVVMPALDEEGGIVKCVSCYRSMLLHCTAMG